LACGLFKKYGRMFSSPVHVRCGRVMWKNRVCGKIYPACEANDDTYSAKNRFVLRRVAAACCPHLSLIAKWCIDYQIRYRRYDFGTGNSLQKIKHFTWYLNFHPFPYFSLFIFSSFCSAKAFHVISDKQPSISLSPTDIRRSQFHHLRCHVRWWCNTLRLRHSICSDSL